MPIYTHSVHSPSYVENFVKLLLKLFVSLTRTLYALFQAYCYCLFVILPNMANSFNRDLVDEQDAKSIRDSMFGRQTRLLVTIGHGYHGLADRIVEPLMSPRDRQDNFVLLWAIGN